MKNYWIVLFSADGNLKKSELPFYVGTEEGFDPGGLVELGKLTAEYFAIPNTDAANGGEAEISVNDPVLAVGDQYRHISDDEYRKFFGDETYQTEMREISDGYARLEDLTRRVAELPRRGW